ncbi:MAG: gamma-glutamyltransferase, partial [Bacteroidia bacterium]|nr:gamma-glutamyltransferase [Bacteroidia bacterium]
AAAVIFNLSVSDYGLFCIGGEVPFMFYESGKKKVIVFNGMGSAPLDPEAIAWYYENGIPKIGIKSATVPSAVSTVLTALESKGTMSFEDIIKPTLALLDSNKKEWHRNLAATLRKLVEAEKNTSGSREDKIRAARDRFYKGDIADELNTYYINSGAFLRKADLVAHKTVIEEPVSVKYKELTVYKCNTWTQGPVLLQSLKILENFNLKSMGFFSPDYIHVTAEAMKLSYADRDKYYGDPSFVKVPLNSLISDQYAKLRYPLIDMKTASAEIRPGDPLNMKPLAGPGEYRPGEKGTTTCVVIDKWGNVVAATPSANPEYGICESLGIAHNTRLSSLNTEKGHPNSIAPGKRPRITLTPTIVLKDDKPYLAMSVAGGDMQDQVSLQLLLDVAEFGMKPEEAIGSPRFYTHHIEDSFNPAPDPSVRRGKLSALDIYNTDKSVVDNLAGRGHIMSIVKGAIAHPVMIYTDQVTGISYAATQKGKKCGAADDH